MFWKKIYVQPNKKSVYHQRFLITLNNPILVWEQKLLIIVKTFFRLPFLNIVYKASLTTLRWGVEVIESLKQL